MSLVTVKVPNAPEPLACIRRSGITSRTKFASFSLSHKSWVSNGPRAPAVILFWLSTTGAPASVVRWVTGHFLKSWLIIVLRYCIHVLTLDTGWILQTGDIS